MRQLGEGDRVALVVPGSLDYVHACIGLLAEGVFPVPLDPRLTAAEQARIFETVDPTLIVTDPAEVARFVPGSLARPMGRPMHCTSGTTGTPKGVYSGVLSAADADALIAEERDLWGFNSSDINLVLSPLYHSAPLRFATGTLLAGGRLALPPGGFDPVAVTELIRRERPTSMFCVPVHLQRLFSHWDEVGWPDLSPFRLVAHAGAPCPEAVKRRLIERFPPGSTWEFYGATEGQFTACPSEEWLERPGTVGRARPGRRMSADPDGTLWCTAPKHARFTYFNDPEKTAAAWRGDSFTVGDLGRVDADGYVWLDGRRVDLIITGGVNVYPAEVEQVLGQAPGVEDIAVVGVTDAQWGQRVVAYVVGDADEEDLRAFAAERLSPPKRPKSYVKTGTLPRTLTGKVRRSELVD